MAKNEEKKNRTNNDMEDFDMDDIFEGTEVPEIEGRDEKAEETDSKDDKKSNKDKNGKKKAKGKGAMADTSNKLTKANNWLEHKVRKYPKFACGVFFTIGTAVGVAGTFLYNLVTSAKSDDGSEDPLNTDFVASETDSDTVIDND